MTCIEHWICDGRGHIQRDAMDSWDGVKSGTTTTLPFPKHPWTETASGFHRLYSVRNLKNAPLRPHFYMHFLSSFQIPLRFPNLLLLPTE
jgi:hypothetical protein